MGMGLELCGCGKKNQEEEDTQIKQDSKSSQSTPLTNIETPSSTPINTQNSPKPNIDDLILIDKSILIGKGKGDIKEKYDIGKKLGGGTFGQVYLCINKKTNEKVAVKVLTKNKKNSKINKEILNEIELLKVLDHRNIINIFEFYEGNYNIYIVTQYCKSGNLFQYVRKTNNHVLYRVTPYYSGNNLLLSHIQIEAMSFEDKGQGICFNVKLDNIQPGIYINYADGNSHVELSNDKI